jgi:hypothetical protein
MNPGAAREAALLFLPYVDRPLFTAKPAEFIGTALAIPEPDPKVRKTDTSILGTRS